MGSEVIMEHLSSETRDLSHLIRNHLKFVTGLITGHCHLKGHVYRLELVDNHICNRCLECCETALHMLSCFETLAGLMHHHFRLAEP
jgi:hypothetical protein